MRFAPESDEEYKLMNNQNFQLSASLQQGLELMNQNKLTEAKQLFMQVCEANPQEAEAWHFLSTVNGRMGDIAAASECCRRTLELQPDHCQARVNLGNVFYMQGNLHEAIAEYQKALQLKPEHTAPSLYNKLGIALAESGKADEALACFQEALRHQPDYADAYRNMGYVHAQQGEQDKAVSAFQHALSASPDNAEIFNDLGAAYFELGNIEQGISCFQRALELNPRHIAALNNLGIACRPPERLPLYVAAYRKTIELLANPTQARTDFIENITLARPTSYDPWLDRELTKCFSIPGINYRPAAIVATLNLIHKYDIDSVAPDDHIRLRNIIERINDDDLFLKFLELTINTNTTLELFLARVRRHLLFKHCEDGGLDGQYLSMTIALAFQGFNNEYVLTVAADEQSRISGLKDAIEQYSVSSSLSHGQLEAELCVYGMYAPVYSLACRQQLHEMPPSGWSEKFRLLLEYTLAAPLEEEQIKQQIETIGEINDQTSRLVRSQYEENPYPRWLSIPTIKKTTTKRRLKQLFPSFTAPDFLDEPLRILVAGCGTGQQPIQRALAYPDAEILAVDISSSSLAYAIRMARKYQATNIRFMQGDILELSKLDRSFHIIECIGVLHHMQDPLSGWKVLNGLLVKNGLMTIGLYSERARKQIVAAREVIKKENLIPNSKNIRDFRLRVMNRQMGDLLYKLTQLGDFYTTSRCRDLLFHFMEHRFTLFQIDQILHELQLDFLGFEFPNEPINNNIMRTYRSHFPDDRRMANLALWDRYEAMYPDTFITMYNFWCQKGN